VEVLELGMLVNLSGLNNISYLPLQKALFNRSAFWFVVRFSLVGATFQLPVFYLNSSRRQKVATTHSKFIIHNLQLITNNSPFTIHNLHSLLLQYNSSYGIFILTTKVIYLNYVKFRLKRANYW
jgi:hypothetical protein